MAILPSEISFSQNAYLIKAMGPEYHTYNIINREQIR